MDDQVVYTAYESRENRCIRIIRADWPLRGLYLIDKDYFYIASILWIWAVITSCKRRFLTEKGEKRADGHKPHRNGQNQL